MGKALELLAGIATAPGTTLTALTMQGGTSLTVRNAADGSKIELLQAWAKNQTAGVLRVRSPQLHDNVQGIRLNVLAADPENLLPTRPLQPLIPQDTLVAELSGSGTAGDIEIGALLVAYQDLPGITGRFIDPDELSRRAEALVTVENTISTGTSGDFTGAEALNAEFDLLRANRDYALLGFNVSAVCGAVRYRGSDFGNLGVGGPGNQTNPSALAEYFVRLSRIAGEPWIPVFNAANVANLLVDVIQDEDGADVTVTTMLALLSQS